MSPSDILLLAESLLLTSHHGRRVFLFLCDFIWNVKANEINYISDVCNRKFSMYDQENQDNI